MGVKPAIWCLACIHVHACLMMHIHPCNLCELGKPYKLIFLPDQLMCMISCMHACTHGVPSACCWQASAAVAQSQLWSCSPGLEAWEPWGIASFIQCGFEELIWICCETHHVNWFSHKWHHNFHLWLPSYSIAVQQLSGKLLGVRSWFSESRASLPELAVVHFFKLISIWLSAQSIKIFSYTPH